MDEESSPLNGAMSKTEKIALAGWLRVVHAADCPPCDMCEEPVCVKCDMHYADCDCPGPMQEDDYEYETFDGVEYARRLYDADSCTSDAQNY